MSNNKNWLYMHDTPENCAMFVAKVKATIRGKKDADVINVLMDINLTGTDPGPRTILAKATIYDEMINFIGKPSLVETLSLRYEDDGPAAMKYIKSFWQVGTDAHKHDITHADYQRLAAAQWTVGVDADVARDAFSEMTRKYMQLKGGTREITVPQHSHAMIDLVKRTGDKYELEVRLTTLLIAEPEKVAQELEGIVAKLQMKTEASATTLTPTTSTGLSAMLTMCGISEAEVVAMIVNERGGQHGGQRPRGGRAFEKPKECDSCGIPHGGACHANLIAQGKPVPGWNTKPEDMRKRIEARAEEIKTKGPWKDRSDRPLVAFTEISTRGPTVLAATSLPKRFEIHIDSKGGPGHPFHFICDKELFVSKEQCEPVVVGGIGDNKIEAREVGWCRIIDPDTQCAVELHNCLYAPEFQYNLFNVWAAFHNHGVESYFNDVCELHFPSGQRVKFSSECVWTVLPSRPATIAALAAGIRRPTMVQRGDGPLHIDIKPLDDKERALFDVASAQLNDPAPRRLAAVHKVLDGAPGVLRKANMVNTATDARLLANAPAMPTVERTAPVATRPGQITQIDLWKPPCTSVLGNTSMMSVYDNNSRRFIYYPLKLKSQAPRGVDQYYLDSKAIGVTMDEGGKLWSDNEIVLNSVAMNEVAEKHDQTRGNSNEYEPWGNAGSESTFRIGPAEMRKLHQRSGVPDEFWDFSAMQACELLNDTRIVRDNKSPTELFGAPRPNMSKKYRVWGCRVIARKPIPWRDGKLDTQAVDGINLGRARTKPGWWVWSPEYGLFTSSNVTFFQDDFPFKDGRYALTASAAKSMAATTGGGGGGGGVMSAAPVQDDDDGDDDGGGDDGADTDDSDTSGLGNSKRPDNSGLGNNGGYSGDSDDSSDTDSDGDSGPGSIHPNVGWHPSTQAASVSGGDQSSISHGTMDDPSNNPSGTSWRGSDLDSEVSSQMIKVLMSLLNKKKEQRASGIPPPWRSLRSAPLAVQELFMAAEMKEINGILDTGSAYEVRLDHISDNHKVYGTLTLRDTKKNGPKKGQAKVRVCVNQGPENVESHSPTMQMVTLRALLAMGGAKKAKLRAGDFPQAYLNADQDVYYVWPPKTARQYDDDGNRLVWALPKALYGGRASGRHWYKKLRNWFEANGFAVSEWDPCLFYKIKPDGKYHYVGVYVDDLIHVYDDDAGYAETVAGFERDFHGYSDLGPLTEIFNAEVDVTDKHITLTQSRFIATLADKYLVGEVFKTHTPADDKLLAFVREASDPKSVGLSAEDHAKYRELVGAMLYCSTVCRPDIAVAVGLLSRVLEKPTADMMAAALRTLRYLQTTKDLGLRWNVGGDETLVGMSDSDWAVVKSTSGYVFFMCQAAIAYISKKQGSIAMSSTEAEIMAASLAALEAVFLRGILKEFRQAQLQATVIHVDNQGAVALAKNYISNSRTKHIERRHLKIRELTEEMQVRPEFIPTDENVADILTKPLGRARFEKLRRLLMNHEV